MDDVRLECTLQKGETVQVTNGEIVVIDFMGDDAAVVQAARISYGKGTKSVREDRGLIRYLMRHRHTTPFEQCELKLRVRCPMDTWRQWIRHRTASVNEYSTRYSEAINEMATTLPQSWRLQSGKNKQGSGEFLEDATLGQHLSEEESELHELSRAVYEERLRLGVAREQARKDLPLSTFTEAYWKIDLHNLLHFLELRMDAHAQLEIREFANAIGSLVEKWVPMVWEAFFEYRLRGETFSRAETMAMMTMMDPQFLNLNERDIRAMLGRTSIRETLHVGEREWSEFIEKMVRIHGRYSREWDHVGPLRA